MSARLESPFTWDHRYLPMMIVNGTGYNVEIAMALWAIHAGENVS